MESEDLEVRQRRVHGWLGIARELDRKEYGIDFLRNGRKIVRFDKEIFRWDDPDDLSGSGEPEYPIELPANAGRIVGEIHLDHVRVTTRKAHSTKQTQRGGLPDDCCVVMGHSCPRKRAPSGMAATTRRLRRLHRGYRRNVPGYDYLTPGLGTDKRARRDTSEWVKKFHDGDPDYQSDEKWWAAIVEHEETLAAKAAAKREQEEAERDGEDPTAEFGPDAPTEADGVPTDEEDDTPEPEPEQPLSDEQLADRLLPHAIAIPGAERRILCDRSRHRPMSLRAWATRGHPLQLDGRRVPVWITSGDRGSFRAFVDVGHPHFRYFDDEPEDVLLMEIAQSLIVRAPRGSSTPISAVFAELKERHLQAHAIDPGRLIPEAGSLIHDVQERMVECVADNPERPWLALADADATSPRSGSSRTSVSPTSSRHLLGRIPQIRAELRGASLVEEWPEAFFDDHLFGRPLPARRWARSAKRSR